MCLGLQSITIEVDLFILSAQPKYIGANADVTHHAMYRASKHLLS